MLNKFNFDNLYIRNKIMMTAKMPSGCDAKDALIFPWNSQLIEWPNPQPGQKSIPIMLKAHSV